MICLASCDKTLPGQLMAAGRINIPTLVVVRERVMLAVEAGYLTGEQMDDLLRQAREVDMQALLEAEGGSSENQEESS